MTSSDDDFIQINVSSRKSLEMDLEAAQDTSSDQAVTSGETCPMLSPGKEACLNSNQYSTTTMISRNDENFEER